MATNDNTPLQLNQILAYAEQAIVYAKKIAPESFSRSMLNQPEYELIKGSKFEQLSEKFNAHQKLRQKYLIEEERIPVKWDNDPPKIDMQDKSYQQYARAWFNANIHASKETSVGNCESLCLLAMECLSQILPKNVPIEIFQFVKNPFGSEGHNKDHVFIVIGRDQTKDPTKITDWGPRAVICDPWADTAYAATLENIQKDLHYITSEYHRESGETRQQSRAFNQKTDIIKAYLNRDILFPKSRELISSSDLLNLNKKMHTQAEAVETKQTETTEEERKKIEEARKKEEDDFFKDIYDDRPSI